MKTNGQELRAAREARGWSVAEVSERTRINARYIEALERDDHAAFPSGPFLQGFSKKYRALLELPERAPAAPPPRPVAPEPDDEPAPVTVTSPVHPSSATRRQVIRTAVVGGLVSLVVLLAVRAFGDAAAPDAGAIGEPPDLAVKVDVEEAVRVRANVDGERVFADSVKPGRGQVFSGRDRVSVELETLDGVELQFQGKPLKPLGHQSRPRRLVFIDDGG